MARIRTIKPEFPQSESMGRVSREARLLFILLWPICDDFGRTRAASRMLASLLYPYDDDAKDRIDGWLDELEREGCIRRYEVDGSKYLQVEKWSQHQKIDNPSQTSRHPPPPPDSRTLSSPREESSRIKEGIKERKGKNARARGSLSSDELNAFETWYALYPHKVGRGAAERAWPRAAAQAAPDELLAGLRRYIAAKPPDVPWCNPATWLNGKRWLDRPAERPMPPGGKSTTDADAETARWQARLRNYRPGGHWLDSWGARPETGLNASIPGPILAAWRQEAAGVARSHPPQNGPKTA